MSTTTRPTTIIFDYCEVVAVAPDHEQLSRLAHAAGMSVPTLTQRFWQYRPAYDVGIPAQSYWSRVTERQFDGPDDPELRILVELDIACWMTVDPLTIGILNDLVTAGVRLVLLSNLPQELAHAVRNSASARFFSRLIFSADIGVAKPDAAAYEALLKLEEVAPEATVFVDDRADNVQTAAALGIDAIRFVDAKQLRAALQRRSISGL